MPTPTEAAVAVAPLDVEAPPPVDDTPAGPDIPPEAIVGGAFLLLVLVYIVLYLRGLAAVERYAGGFAVEHCPVCRDGALSVELRQGRWLGIPQARRLVRCDSCRSVLRETGYRRWRYAVDRLENAAMYERFNGREIDERMLRELARRPVLPGTAAPVTPPTFVDGE